MEAAPVQPVAPVAPPAKPRINFRNSIAVRVAFLTAALITLIGSMPFPMVFATLWRLIMLVAGGFYAVYLYGRRTGQPVSIRGGVSMGWITGVFAFVITTVILTVDLTLLSSSGGIRELFRKAAENSPAQDAIDQMLSTDSGLATYLLLGLFFLFLMSTLLPIVGGALGAKVFEKE